MNILLVNLPTERGKRSHFGRLPFQHATNFGLLAIASTIAERGDDVRLFDARLEIASATEYLAAFQREAESRPWDVVGFSCLSGFSYPALKEWSEIARRSCRDAFIMVGGQDHVGRMPEYTLADNDALNAVVVGEGEGVIEAVLNTLSEGLQPKSIIGLKTPLDLVTQPAVPPSRLPRLNYALSPTFRKLPASVEFARGCPFTCDFCVSARSGLRRRSPAEMVAEIQHALASYEIEDLPLYFEAPIFVAPPQYLSAFADALAAAKLRPVWRAETRVDVIDPADAAVLWRCGMRVVDLGLESASPPILRKMGKTTNPDRYLGRASQLVRALAEVGVFVKLNILFYAGETPDTLAETRRWLEAHRPYIGAVAAYPLLIYPGIEGEANIRSVVREAGGSFVDSAEWRSRRLVPVNVSRHFTYDALLEIAHDLEASFQRAEQYFYQRRFGYFSPTVSFDEFLNAVSALDPSLFPFAANRLSKQNQRITKDDSGD